MIRLFDDIGDGYITVDKFREILREIDPAIDEEELDGIISDVSPTIIAPGKYHLYFRWTMMALAQLILTSFVK